MLELHVVRGPGAGATLAVPPGTSFVGRDPSADLRIDCPEVSKRHARLEHRGGRVTIQDLGSTNGTLVNDKRSCGTAQVLHNGDTIRMGPVELVVDDQSDGSGRCPDTARSAGASGGLLRMAAVAGAVQFVGLLVQSGVTVGLGLVLSTPVWLVTPIAAAVAGMLMHSLQPRPSNGSAYGRSRTSGAAVLLTVVVIGVACLAITAGTRYGVGYLSGKEPQRGGERLAAESLSTTNGKVTLTVTSIVDTAHFTRVAITVRNGYDETVSLNLYPGGVLVADEALPADAFRSTWSGTVPPNVPVSGRIIFRGHVPASTRSVHLSLGPYWRPVAETTDRTLVLRDIPLRAP